MAENLERTTQSRSEEKALHIENRTRSEEAKETESMADKFDTSEWKNGPLHLPDEIIVPILEYVWHHSTAEQTLASCCLLSRQWYNVAVPLLYGHPLLYGNNFDLFVRAICPSKNAHVIPTPLSSLVKILDMSRLVHQGSRSTTARLLGRTKGNLEGFIAPQASFSTHCFPALSKCQRLHLLDLSLVSESPPLPELFKTVSNLTSLQTLRLPRSSGFGVHHTPSSFSWPPNLQHLSLSGGIDAHFLHGIVAFPSTLRSLTIEHCPNAKGYAVTHLLRTAIQPLAELESLKIAHMPRLGSRALDDVLFLLPQISRLSVSVDYITPALFDESHFQHIPAANIHVFGSSNANVLPITVEDELIPDDELPTDSFSHSNLRTLELTNSGSPSGVEDKVTPIDIMIAIDEGALLKLRQVRVARSLLWESSSTREDVDALTEALQEGSKRDWEGREWVFEDKREYGKDGEERWRDVAGVWVFDG